MELNEEHVKKILETKPIKIPDYNVFSDTALPKEERIRHAKELLENWSTNTTGVGE